MIQLPRDWIIQLIFSSTVLSILSFGFWLAYKPWFKLSQTYRSELPPPKVFLEEQSGILGQTRIKGYLNIGISERGLYLSHTSPLSYLIKPLLIDWEAIASLEPTTEALWGNGCQLLHSPADAACNYTPMMRYVRTIDKTTKKLPHRVVSRPALAT